MQFYPRPIAQMNWKMGRKPLPKITVSVKLAPSLMAGTSSFRPTAGTSTMPRTPRTSWHLGAGPSTKFPSFTRRLVTLRRLNIAPRWTVLRPKPRFISTTKPRIRNKWITIRCALVCHTLKIQIFSKKSSQNTQ